MSVKFKILLVLFLGLLACSSEEDNPLIVLVPEEDIYFPPINSSEWETKSVTSLSWNVNALQPLLDFLDEKNTKSFIILHEGKIVVESYFNGHTANLPWYWASAGKTLTTAVTGIAESENLININNKVSDYIGTG